MIVQRVADDERAEALVRSLSRASRDLVWVADHALRWGELHDVAVLGTISLAERIGRARRGSGRTGGDVASAVAAEGGGSTVFKGQVTSHESRGIEGFTVGETLIAGRDRHRGSIYRIWFKNENIMAWRDGLPDVMCPDLICLLDDSTGEPVANS